MKIKQCTCGKHLTTKNAIYKGRLEGIMYWNCPDCQSTLTLISRAILERIKRARSPAA